MFAIQDHAPSQEDEADGGVNEVLDYEPGHATLANAIKVCDPSLSLSLSRCVSPSPLSLSL